MKTILTSALTMILAAGAAFGQDAPPPAQSQNQQSGDPLATALNQLLDSLAELDQNAVPANVNPADEKAVAAARARSKKETVAIISAATALGSAVGAMIAKDDRAKGAAIGAAVGGIAGLIFDRMQASNNASNKQTPAESPAPAAPQPKQPEKPEKPERPEKKVR